MAGIGSFTQRGHRPPQDTRYRPGVGILTGWSAAALGATLIPFLLATRVPVDGVTALVDTLGFGPYVLIQTALISAAVAALQWRLLRRHVPLSPAWIIASVSTAIGGAALSLAVAPRTTAGMLIGALLVGAPMTGLAQWLVLRQVVQQAWRWVPALMLSSLLGILAALGLEQLALIPADGTGGMAPLLLIAAIPPLLRGQIEGRTLRWLLRNPAP